MTNRMWTCLPARGPCTNQQSGPLSRWQQCVSTQESFCVSAWQPRLCWRSTGGPRRQDARALNAGKVFRRCAASYSVCYRIFVIFSSVLPIAAQRPAETHSHRLPAVVKRHATRGDCVESHPWALHQLSPDQRHFDKVDSRLCRRLPTLWSPGPSCIRVVPIIPARV